MNGFLRNFYQRRCHLDPKFVGYVIGWFGVIYRTFAILLLAIIISRLTEDDNKVFHVMYPLLLTYCFVSLASNFLLIVGISKEKPYYLLPYLSIDGIEIFVCVIFLIAGTIFFIKTETALILSYFLPCGLFVLALYTYLWLYLIQLFKQFENVVEAKSINSSHQETDFEIISCNWNCFKSDSLDIAT